MSRGIDLDRLADFVGGALDGTPDADAVRHLIATDAGWAEAYESLLAADAVVQAELGSLTAGTLTASGLTASGLTASGLTAASDESMPADVVVRLERLLTDLPPLTSPAPATGTVVQLDDVRRRRRRFTIALSTAAAVIAVGFASIVVVPLLAGESAKTASSGRDSAAAPALATAPSGDIVVLATGVDYRPETLGTALRTETASGYGFRAQDKSAPDQGASTVAGTPYSVPGVSPALAQLTDPVTRAACIAAIVATYGGRVTLIDLARFQGAPAATVLVEGAAAGAGHTLAVVVGGTCGQTGAGAAELYHRVV
jgi:hypothetical protein